MNPQELIDKAIGLMNQHLDQIKTTSTYITKDGAKGLTGNDAGVIEKYAKVLLMMTKGTQDTSSDDLDNMSEADLLKIINERQDNVDDKASD